MTTETKITIEFVASQNLTVEQCEYLRSVMGVALLNLPFKTEEDLPEMIDAEVTLTQQQMVDEDDL